MDAERKRTVIVLYWSPLSANRVTDCVMGHVVLGGGG